MNRQPSIIRFVVLAALGVALADGQNPPSGPQQPTSTIPTIEESKSTPDAPSAPVDPSSYIIGAEDQLRVRVWREPDVSGDVTVRPDGKITLPLVGEIQAAGRTPQALAQTLTEKLSEFLNRPEVMVEVRAVRSKKYYITGQVNKTGAFPLTVPTTVLEALSGAGGFQQWAKKKKIVILRGNKRFKFNYNEVIEGKNLQQNIYLENGDHIIVP